MPWRSLGRNTHSGCRLGLQSLRTPGGAVDRTVLFMEAFNQRRKDSASSVPTIA